MNTEAKEAAVVRLQKHETSTHRIVAGLRELARETEQLGTNVTAIRLEVGDLVLEFEHLLRRIQMLRLRSMTIPALVESTGSQELCGDVDLETGRGCTQLAANHGPNHVHEGSDGYCVAWPLETVEVATIVVAGAEAQS